jgi:basic membrane protein A
VIVRILEGYKLGAKSVNPDVTVLTTYVGAWDDPARGKEAAVAQIEAGADVLYHVADKTGLGVIQAAQEAGVYAIGSASDQSSVAPGAVLSSSTEVVESAYLQLARAVLDGTFKAQVYRLGLASGTLDYAPMPDVVPQDVQDLVEATKKSIIDGTFTVPEVTQPTEP